MKSFWSEDVKIGDLICLSEENYLSVGIFCGRGPTGTVQYFSLPGLRWWMNQSEIKKPYKSYINTYYETRVSRFHLDGLKDEWKEIYYKAKEKLKI